jgi:hypothetical protein
VPLTTITLEKKQFKDFKDDTELSVFVYFEISHRGGGSFVKVKHLPMAFQHSSVGAYDKAVELRNRSCVRLINKSKCPKQMRYDVFIL